MPKPKTTLIDRHIKDFITSNFDKRDREQPPSVLFEWFVNSMHIWHTSSQLYNGIKNIGQKISLDDSCPYGDSFYITINNNEKLYTLQDDIEEIIKYLKDNGKKITFYFIQSKKTDTIDLGEFFKLVELPLNIWKGQEIRDARLKKVEDFINQITNEDDVSLNKINHEIVLLFYTNKNKNAIDQLNKTWETIINNKKSELAEYFSPQSIKIEFRGSDFLNNTYEKLVSNDYQLSINKNEVIFTDDRQYLIGYFTAKELLDAIAPINNDSRVLLQDVFKNNIRLYLGQNDINKNIEQTLLKEPKKFHLYNNGITITTKEIKTDNSKNYTISSVNIVNGCQTANSIFNVCNKSNFDSSEIKIPVKIIVAQDSEYERITIYSNTQTGIDAKDLFSINIIQKELQEKFNSTVFINKTFYYKRQKAEHVDNDDANFIIQIDDILRAAFSTLMLIPNKVSGYFDKTTSKYLNTIFNEDFIDIYLKTTVLLKLIEDFLKEKYPDQIRLKYHILYIVYRIIVKEKETRLKIAAFFKEPDDREQLLKEINLEESISIINKALDRILSTEEKFNKLVNFVINTFREKFPAFFEITDKKTEKILYTFVEKLKYVQNVSMQDFDDAFSKKIDEIIE